MNGNRVALRVHNPSGNVDMWLSHAPRLDSLAGKTICELSNGSWEYDRIFPAVRELLQRQFPAVRILPYEEVISGKLDLDNVDTVARVVRDKKCDAVISGMAA